MDVKCGIYKITSPSGKCYIGQSIDIFKRWRQEKSAARSEKNPAYNSALSQAIRKYGEESLNWEILEECSAEQLDEREIYWISAFDSFKNGYNQSPGGQGKDSHTESKNVGSDNPSVKLTEEEVVDIRQRWHNCKELCSEIFDDYRDRMSISNFYAIINWSSWKELVPELNQESVRQWHKKDKGITNRSKTCYFDRGMAIRARALYKLGYGPMRINLEFPGVSLRSVQHLINKESWEELSEEEIDGYIEKLKETNHIFTYQLPRLRSKNLSYYDVLDIRVRKMGGESAEEIQEVYYWLDLAFIKRIFYYYYYVKVSEEMVKEELEWRKQNQKEK